MSGCTVLSKDTEHPVQPAPCSQITGGAPASAASVSSGASNGVIDIAAALPAQRRIKSRLLSLVGIYLFPPKQIL